AAGKEVQCAVKGRKAELRDLLETNAASAAEAKSALPPALVAAFDANVEQGGPGAAVLTGPNGPACGQRIGAAAWQAVLSLVVNETYECEECEEVLLRRD